MISSGKLTQPVYFNVVLGTLRSQHFAVLPSLLLTLGLTVVVSCISVIGMSIGPILFQKSFEFSSFQRLTPSSMPKNSSPAPGRLRALSADLAQMEILLITVEFYYFVTV